MFFHIDLFLFLQTVDRTAVLIIVHSFAFVSIIIIIVLTVLNPNKSPQRFRVKNFQNLEVFDIEYVIKCFPEDLAQEIFTLLSKDIFSVH